MIAEGVTAKRAEQRVRRARLHLDGVDVGSVSIRGRDTSWWFGDFTPSPAFSRFAPCFGHWSLMMHADGESERFSPEVAEELRQAEMAIDRLQAVLQLEGPEERRAIQEINIDGPLIEWKEA